MSLIEKHFYEFGEFRLDPSERLLLYEETPVAITPKAFDLLLALIESSGQVVTKDQLMNCVWRDTFVGESNLTFNISMLRKALAEASNGASFIETVPRRGYRFTAMVSQSRQNQPQLIVEKLTVSNITIETEDRETINEVATLNEVAAKAIQAQESPLRSAASDPISSKTLNRKTLVAAFLLLVLALASSYLLLANKSKSAPPLLVNSIAVLPFKLVNTDANDEYLGLGMADALITRLGNLQQIVVRPTSAVRKYAAQEQDTIAIGKALKVNAALEGSIQKAGDHLRVTVQLMSIGDGRHLWAEKFDANLTDIFAVQDAIADRCANALALKLVGKDKALLTKRYTDNLEAYQLYMQGRYLWNKRNEADMRKGISYFQQAIALDPNYALAYCGLADSYAILPALSVTSTKECAAKAKEAALNALVLDGSLAEAHTSLATVLEYFDWQRDTATKEYELAIESNPNYAIARHRYGVHLTSLGRFEDALAQLNRAQELDPLSLATTANLGWVFLCWGDYDQAIEQCKKALDIDENFIEAVDMMALAYELKGMNDAAVSTYLKVARLMRRQPEEIAALQSAYQSLGIKGYWQKQLEFLLRESPAQNLSPMQVAAIYTRLDEPEKTFAWLERAYQERQGEVIWLKVSPTFNRFRSDPRFANILRRVGFN